ncbi:DUF3572 domain-containing protein [Roseovarius sp. SCSIO 43702]|uniref:DUF3572 domain-containing protein n=1 Tax=Roseovarius sp. SCSIO 43702 TaxID=2823043 RepID=UPI001C72BDD3|nr:DUF3572 domain-containing protein [Roseovarius sp. SCSIO 43702]QYX57923.1 DUF3572 domain-containing protein [Roseovarius sp. SCSIO 43702]
MRSDEPKSADTLGLEALAWLVGNDELLPVFLGSTGASEDDLRAGATDPSFLAAVLDFVMLDDAWVLGFARDTGHAPEAVLRARRALPGGAHVEWT